MKASVSITIDGLDLSAGLLERLQAMVRDLLAPTTPDVVDDEPASPAAAVVVARELIETNRPDPVDVARGQLEKPYGCDLCGERFARPQGRGAHRRYVHRIHAVTSGAGNATAVAAPAPDETAAVEVAADAPTEETHPAPDPVHDALVEAAAARLCACGHGQARHTSEGCTALDGDCLCAQYRQVAT